MKLNPWGSANIDNYSKLFEEFGISNFESVLNTLKDPHKYMKRKIIFGHRGYELIVDAIENKKPFSVMSGFMPSGNAHLGAKMVMDEIIWHQKKGGSAFVGIADREAHSVRGMSWKLCREIGINEYILSLIAFGYEPDGLIYFQSECEVVKDLCFELGIKANFSELSAIYGFDGATNVSHMVSALSQSADILQPQVEEWGGPKPTVVPVGADQDPHIRLTRGLASKMNLFKIEQRTTKDGICFLSIRSKGAPSAALKKIKKLLPWDAKLFEGHMDVKTNDFNALSNIVSKVEIEFGGYAFIPPVSIYHRFMSGLQGGKMSSSVPESHIALTDTPKDGAKKVKQASTGGRATLKEQKELGGNPDNCSVFELMLFHLIEDDKDIAEIYSECKEGNISCGTCKVRASELMFEFLKDHGEERKIAKERLGEYGLSVN